MDVISNAVISLAEKHLGEFKIRNNEVVPLYCPFCKGGNNGDAETFGVGLYNGAWSCKRGSCGKKGSFKDLCDFFGEKQFETINPLHIQMRNKKKEYRKLNESEIKHEITDDIITYFAKRRIGEQTLKDFNIGSDKNGNILFPFYRNRELVYVKYRKPEHYTGEPVQVIENGVPKFDAQGKPVMRKPSKEWQERDTEQILFGMDNVSLNKTLIITEGEMDAMSIYESGLSNVVSVPCGCNNFEWIENCFDWLEQFQQIILFGDNDEPGIEMVNTLMKRLGEDRCLIPKEYPELVFNGKDYNRQCKDANEILKAYGPEVLKEIIESCQPVPIKGIINLADVPFVDPTTIPRILTGIPQLDNMIGGFGEGGVTVFSGKRGEGRYLLSLNIVNLEIQGVA